MSPDTIFALASGAGMSGVAVIRVSGPKSLEALAAFRCKLVRTRLASLRRLIVDDELIDEALVLSFEPRASLTGEHVLEFQTHGSPAVVAKVLDHLGSLPGFRLAAPGEFTRRAFENGNMDLLQVDGLARLIDAETEAQRKQAMSVFSGRLSKELEAVRYLMLRAAALCEAVIDFADEDVPVDVTEEVSDLIGQSIRIVEELLSGAHQARRLQNGYEVAIVGPPNVGKSSLINALTKRDVAIVSDVAGTTRDVLEARLDLDGLLVSFLDTAGFRDTEDSLEKIGMERALARAERADIRIFLHDATEPELYDLWQNGDIVAETKGDVSGKDGSISSVSGKGLDHLLNSIKETLKARSSAAGLMSSARHEEGLKLTHLALTTAVDLLIHQHPDELVAEELRTAARKIESLLGRIDVEDILGEVFSSFCIGK